MWAYAVLWVPAELVDGHWPCPGVPFPSGRLQLVLLSLACARVYFRYRCMVWVGVSVDLSLFFPLFAGVSGVQGARFEEAMSAKHCAVSLVGEPIMYPEIKRFVRLLHRHSISTFLVTNAQFPDEIR